MRCDRAVRSAAGMPAVAHADLCRRALDRRAGGGRRWRSRARSADRRSARLGRRRRSRPRCPTCSQLAVRQAPSLATRSSTSRSPRRRSSRPGRATTGSFGRRRHGSRSGAASSAASRSTRSSDRRRVRRLTRMLPTGGTHRPPRRVELLRTPRSSASGPAADWLDAVSRLDHPAAAPRPRRWLFNANEQQARLVRDAAVLARRLAAIDTCSP